ncbi:MAG: hypothetical protein HETSPECPRED_008497 [Heterodermia speciosa]|uniref:NAD(P)-binding protein n=1 Tax=Heterodermia speciosa TaxID=116794 RepID=A0A8H3IUM2_9LECA|nr:MAG: hypothetical protein HETSPECPRED_008497 [Heterodermia speciosa]
MVSLEAVRLSNAKLKNLPPGLVALFVGGTSGIAESTLKQFYRHAIRPRIYIVGRNQDAADRIISELKTSQSEGTATFIRQDLTLLKNVDLVCDEIKRRETKLNVLFMTAGLSSMRGRDETSEGLDRKMTTNYYARMRFIHNLLPLLRASAPELSRAVSVLSPGQETATLNFNDLDLKQNFSLRNAMTYCVTMTDFAFEELAKANPTVSFVHDFPGGVKTGFLKESNILLRAVGNILVDVVARPWMTSIEESGERHLFAATSRRYVSRDGQEHGVGFGKGDSGKGTGGELGSGAYLIGSTGEQRGNEKALEQLRSKGAGEKIWKHTVSVFERVENGNKTDK